jgi:DNA-directed RNA polymerase subunit RPC12/RpoP/DNA polymerase elongation subunit (family B)
MRVLALDIETAPNSVHVWGLWNQNVGLSQIMQTGRVLCFAAKWVGKRGITFRSEHTHGHRETIDAVYSLIGEADAVLTYNGRSFDLPTLNREFLKYGLTPPAPYADIDLILTVRKRFRFASNKLDHICAELGVGKKIRHEGHELWVKCMNGDPKAWRDMERYNKHDVVLLEALYKRILPWIDSHPNAGLYKEGIACPTCGSRHLQQRGLQATRTHKYRRYQCQNCGSWTRERFTVTPKSKVLTQIPA